MELDLKLLHEYKPFKELRGCDDFEQVSVYQLGDFLYAVGRDFNFFDDMWYFTTEAEAMAKAQWLMREWKEIHEGTMVEKDILI